MFSKLPQRLTAPFELGDGAKLAFRSQPGGISRLATTRNISETDSYWDQYIILFDTPSDVFSLITPSDIRRALLDAPENIATLIRVITSRLFNLISDHTFPSPANASVVAYASSFIRNTERNTTKEVLNCIRVLQRVLPVVFEADGESNTFEREVWWKIEEVEDDDAREDAAQESQFVIEDEDDSDQESAAPSQPESMKQKKTKKLPSLGERLFSCITDLLFCCGFTLPNKIQVDHYKINYIIWEKGIGSTADPGPGAAFDANKTEVLRLLLILLSRQIYVPPSSLLSVPSLFTLQLVQKTSRRDVLTLLCSLLNTAMNSAQSTEISIQSMAGKLPYNHLIFKGEDPRSTLVGICFQVLNALLDFQSGPARDITVASANGEIENTAPTAKTNAFRYFLVKLHRIQDFEFITEGVIGVFQQHMASVNNLLPGAKKSIPYISDTVIFLWKMLELNKKFRLYVLESEKGTDIVAYVLAYFIDIKDKPQHHGLCRALSYVIQTLSADSAFGRKLSHPVKAQLPMKYNAGGTYADYVVKAIYSIVATTSGQLNSLYPALIIALSNLAPYFKNLSVTTSTRLIQLFKSFSNPLFLLADEGHPRLLFFMQVLSFNSIILHHFSDNPNLIYGLLTAHKTFEDLGTFTLARGLREIRRAQLAKEEQARKKDAKGKNPAGGLSEDEDPSAEKARLLEREQEGETELAELEEGTRQLDLAETLTPPDGELTARPLTSPTSETFPAGEGPGAISEKARGKMKARRSMSVETTGSLERIAAAGVGKNGFVPTQEWVTSWQQGLPLDSVMLVISEVLPKVQELQFARDKANPTGAIMDLLRSISLEHVLPPAPPMAPRKFLWSDASIVWLTSLIWGEIYVRGMTPLGLWNNTNVRLFYVKHMQTQQRQITETVTSVVGGLFGRTTGGERT
ncbi:hypothetical protein FIBSPDRAFT_919775 [Athelia psychrophila]|uniref:Uncharacterized protein n=1 Tax=Athelia psychrophila TaxID=1759441 RepID=A0A166JF35_9AGAM|nr:hypothetical protein FIBSPDRAFT_919775 [Fibularhizoctonia sp. CBS 109695]